MMNDMHCDKCSGDSEAGMRGLGWKERHHPEQNSERRQQGEGPRGRQDGKGGGRETVKALCSLEELY